MMEGMTIRTCHRCSTRHTSDGPYCDECDDLRPSQPFYFGDKVYLVLPDPTTTDIVSVLDDGPTSQLVTVQELVVTDVFNDHVQGVDREHWYTVKAMDRHGTAFEVRPERLFATAIDATDDAAARASEWAQISAKRIADAYREFDLATKEGM